MLQKIKKFYKRHQKTILYIGGSAIVITGVILLDRKLKKNWESTVQEFIDSAPVYDNTADLELYAKYGAVFKDDSSVPYVTKEMATKFMEERGSTYQIDQLDDLTSVLWITE